MIVIRNDREPSALKSREPSVLKAWVRTHLFRTWTALLTLISFGLAFLYKPEWLTWWLRTTMTGD